MDINNKTSRSFFKMFQNDSLESRIKDLWFWTISIKKFVNSWERRMENYVDCRVESGFFQKTKSWNIIFFSCSVPIARFREKGNSWRSCVTRANSLRSWVCATKRNSLRAIGCDLMSRQLRDLCKLLYWFSNQCRTTHGLLSSRCRTTHVLLSNQVQNDSRPVVESSAKRLTCCCRIKCKTTHFLLSNQVQNDSLSVVESSAKRLTGCCRIKCKTTH